MKRRLAAKSTKLSWPFSFLTLNVMVVIFLYMMHQKLETARPDDAESTFSGAALTLRRSMDVVENIPLQGDNDDETEDDGEVGRIIDDGEREEDDEAELHTAFEGDSFEKMDDEEDSPEEVSEPISSSAELGPGSISQQARSEPRLVVFYNVFTPADGIAQTKAIVQEQLNTMRKAGFLERTALRYILIGQRIEMPCLPSEDCVLMKYGRRGQEDETLWRIHQHCRKFPNDTVTYLHSKGSFHPSVRNTRLRMMHTDALSLWSMRGSFGKVGVQCLLGSIFTLSSLAQSRQHVDGFL